MKRILLLALAAMLTCCATTKSPLRPKDGKFEKDAKAMEGQPLKDLVKRMGYPERTLKSPDGNEVYEYTTNGGTEITSESSGTSYTVPGGLAAGLGTSGSTSTSKVSSLTCVTWFEIKDQKVLNVTWKGNNCIGYETALACAAHDSEKRDYDIFPSEICSNPKRVRAYYFEGDPKVEKARKWLESQPKKPGE